MSKSHFSKKLVLAIGLALLAGNCAKERPIEKISLSTRSDLKTKADFNGPFYSKVTVVQTSNNPGPVDVGYQSQMKLGHFRFTDTHLQFLDDVNAYNEDIKSQNKPQPVDRLDTLINEWEIDHYDYKLDESDGLVHNKEVEDEDKSAHEKRFFTVDFSKAEISEATTFPRGPGCYDKKSIALVDDSFKVEKDSIQYIVAVDYEVDPICNENMGRMLRGDYTFTAHYLYSFVRANPSPDYRPHLYQGENDPLTKKYGYFKTIREVVDPRLNQKKNVILMNRWHPEKTHHYYFAPGTPEKYKWIFNDPKVGVFPLANKIFAENGLKVRFQIHENTWGNGKVKKFGDLRYSFVKFVDNPIPGSLGYGPSDANPLTGEILSGNVVMFAEGMKFYLQLLKDEMKHEQTPAQQRSLFRGMSKILEAAGENPDMNTWTQSWDQSQGAGRLFSEVLPKRTFSLPAWSRFTRGASGAKDSSSAASALLKLPIERAQNMLKSLNPYGNAALIEALDETKSVHQHWGQEELRHLEHAHTSTNSTVYPKEHAFANMAQLLQEGMSPEAIVQSIVYKVAIHEFGHNLNLRHNFYGSVDKLHFEPEGEAEPLVIRGKTVRNREGQPILSEPVTSSVMEYAGLEGWAKAPMSWGTYDKAALVYAYSMGYAGNADGQATDIAADQNLLFCTDEDVPLNFMCNRHDLGTTPSEVMLYQILDYERFYQLRNTRYVRQFWDSRGYQSRILGIMAGIKRSLQFYTDGMPPSAFTNHLKQEWGDVENYDMAELLYDVSEELKNTVRLGMAFFAAVHQQSPADRPWRSEYTLQGHLKRQGVAPDKIYASLFFMGDTPMLVNPNQQAFFSSYLQLMGDPEFSAMMDQLLKFNLTRRIDMIPGFISLGRSLYADVASNQANEANSALINKIRVSRIKFQHFKKDFGFNKEEILANEGQIITLEKAEHAQYNIGDQVAYIIGTDGHIYLISQSDSPYAFDIIKTAVQELMETDRSLVQAKKDVMEMYKLHHSVQ